MSSVQAKTDECRTCHNQLRQKYLLREIMFGTGEKFEYGECGSCGTMQISKFPDNMAPYYPNGYWYSLPETSIRHKWPRRAIKSALFWLGLRYPSSRAGSYLRKVFPSWLLRVPGLSQKSRVLDVGCGNGEVLHRLAGWGFVNLEGVDPFSDADVRQGCVYIRKDELANLSGKYDLVMMHHSLEHVPDPRASLEHARRLLAPHGTLLVRIPLKGGYFWKHYGTDWVQLDPPRHFHTFTEGGFIQLAQATGLKAREVLYDATDFSFWASELVRRGLTIQDEAEISPAEKDRFKVEIEALNEAGESDQACFFLQRDV